MNPQAVGTTALVFFVAAMLACASLDASPLHPTARLDGALRLLSDTPPNDIENLAREFSIHTAATAVEIGALLDYSGDPEALLALGVKTRGRVGSILSVRIPAESLEAVANLPGVKYLQAARRFEPMLDVSVPETGASSLRTGAPPSWNGYTGKGVVIGFVDTGIDPAHIDFRKADGTSRILYLWDQTTGTGGANHPPPYDYGTEWTQAQITSGQCTAVDSSGHGTMVAGTAAGNGSATGYGWPNYRYIGMAPEADIIAVKSTLYSDAIVDGMVYIRDKAESLGKPCVINLSLGSHFGAHDGTDLIERAIDQISGPGVVVCTATGNSRAYDPARHIHAEWVTPTRNSTVTAGLNVLSNRSNPFYLDLWYDGQDSIDITVTSPNGYSVTQATGTTTGGYVSTPDGNIWLQNAPGPVNPYNGDRECVVVVQNAVAGNWSITATGKTIRAGGLCDAWIASQNVYWSSHMSNAKTCSIPGTSVSAITVGGYWTKSRWYNPDGTLQGWDSTYGSFFASSGEGPTRDGRQKPELVTPTAVATTLSSAWNPGTWLVEDGVHVYFNATSLAAPHIAGAAALLLQKDPTATASEIKQRLITTARTDAFTGTVPNTLWGYGKLDVPAALSLTPLYTDVSGARIQPDGALVKLSNALVSAGIAQLADRFYVQSADRSSGIQVRRASGDSPLEGDAVNIVGILGLADGERAILDASVTKTGTASLPRALSLANRNAGGSAFGPSPGVEGGVGLNNIGLLIRVWGKVTHIGSDHFYLDDGSSVQGAGGFIGVKVRCPGLTKPASVGQYAVVTGVSSLELDGSLRRPVLRVRKQSDLLYY